MISAIVESRPGRVSWHSHRVTSVDSLCEMTLFPLHRLNLSGFGVIGA
jgi:hypothetical protein